MSPNDVSRCSQYVPRYCEGRAEEDDEPAPEIEITPGQGPRTPLRQKSWQKKPSATLAKESMPTAHPEEAEINIAGSRENNKSLLEIHQKNVSEKNRRQSERSTTFSNHLQTIKHAPKMKREREL